MHRNLFVLIFLLFAGCIFIVEDPDTYSNNDTYYYSDVWLSDAYVTCYYDAYYDLSEWFIDIYADSYFGPYEVAQVGFYINGRDYQYMDYMVDGVWYYHTVSTSYDCGRYYQFDFVASDYDGYEGYYTYEW